MDGWTDRQDRYRLIDRQTRWMDGLGGWIGINIGIGIEIGIRIGWIDGWMNGRMDERMDGLQTRVQSDSHENMSRS